MQLDPTWSLNRVYIADLPGLDMPDRVKGKTAYHLVSAAALTQLIRQHIAALRLDPHLNDHALRLAYDTTLTSSAPSIRAAAREIARTIGQNLGYILLTLMRGDDINRQARPEWDATHWDHWARIRHLSLGGGLVSGNLGPHIAQHARDVLNESEAGDYTVQVSPYAVDLPLVGAARHAASGANAAAVLDFGNTMIKRALVSLEKSHITGLHRLSSQPAHRTLSGAQTKSAPEQADNLIDRMAAIITATWHQSRQMRMTPSDTIPVSIAAYIKDGNPMAGQTGGYYQTNLIASNLEDELGRRASATLATPVRIKLLHDGTAAAATCAGAQQTAVITLGTALGIGFPGDDTRLRGISDQFTLSRLPPTHRIR